jgi:hypothetical protein
MTGDTLADFFTRRGRAAAEAEGHRLVVVYARKGATSLGFPHDLDDARQQVDDAWRKHLQVAVFRRYPSGVWRLWDSANLAEPSPQARFDDDFNAHFGGSP